MIKLQLEINDQVDAYGVDTYSTYSYKLDFQHFKAGELIPSLSDIVIKSIKNASRATIVWHYENDAELFVVYNLKRFLDTQHLTTSLNLPYVPNARMDRVKAPLYMFTLKNFAEIINSLNFYDVKTLDIHSNVGKALINNIQDTTPYDYINSILKMKKDIDVIMFPDEGAQKRYDVEGFEGNPKTCYGMKQRDWASGKILRMNIEADYPLDELKGKSVLIIDDICSKGYTFYFAAKKLKELGVSHVYLYVSHLENAVSEGELINSDLVDHIYTTNSIYRSNSEGKITVFDIDDSEGVQWELVN